MATPTQQQPGSNAGTFTGSMDEPTPQGSQQVAQPAPVQSTAIPEWLATSDLPDGEKAALAQKFKDPAALAKSYRELERKQGQGAQPQQPAPQQPQTQPGQQALTIEQQQAADIVTRAGLQMDALTQQVAQHGDLTTDQYAALEKAGVPRALAQTYVRGLGAQAALTQQQQTSIKTEAVSLAGGNQQLEAIFAWARQNLTPAQVEQTNRLLASPDTWKTTMLGLKAQRDAAMGASGDRGAVGGTGAGTGATPFTSREQLTKAFTDPKYRTDPAFRAEVEQRMRATPRSNFAAINSTD